MFFNAFFRSNFFSWRESQDRDCKLICRISGTIDRDIDDVDMIPVQFTIQDHGTPPRYGRTTLFVKVHRINDNSPWFPEPTKTFTVFEGVPQRVLYIAKVSN